MKKTKLKTFLKSTRLKTFGTALKLKVFSIVYELTTPRWIWKQKAQIFYLNPYLIFSHMNLHVVNKTEQKKFLKSTRWNTFAIALKFYL